MHLLSPTLEFAPSIRSCLCDAQVPVRTSETRTDCWHRQQMRSLLGLPRRSVHTRAIEAGSFVQFDRVRSSIDLSLDVASSPYRSAATDKSERSPAPVSGHAAG